MPQLYANNASTTLVSGIGTTDLALTVVSADSFPVVTAGSYFYATLADSGNTTWEVVKVTAIAGTTFTITRAQDGTTAKAWDPGSLVELRPVAQTLRDIVNSGRAYATLMSVAMG